MTKNHTLSAPDIAKMMGVSRVTALNWLKTGKIPPAKLANPGGKQGRYDNTPELRASCKKFKKMEAERKARPRATRAQRMSQRRLEKINKLEGILKNRTPVSAAEKQGAIYFCHSLRIISRSTKEFPWIPWPVIEGIWALYKTNRLFYDDNGDWVLDDLVERIESLPTRPKTTPPRNGQFSSNASAQ
jgi:hypothetical protein